MNDEELNYNIDEEESLVNEMNAAEERKNLFIATISAMEEEIQSVYEVHATPSVFIESGIAMAKAGAARKITVDMEYHVDWNNETFIVKPKSCSCSREEQYCAHRVAVGVYRKAMDKMNEQMPIETEAEEAPAGDDTVPDLEVILPDFQSGEAPSLSPENVSFSFHEAPASVNFQFINIEGRYVQWTLRDEDETRLARRYHNFMTYLHLMRQEMQGEFDLVGTSKQVMCPVHKVEMSLKTSKNSSEQWYSHQLENEKWCNITPNSPVAGKSEK